MLAKQATIKRMIDSAGRYWITIPYDPILVALLHRADIHFEAVRPHNGDRGYIRLLYDDKLDCQIAQLVDLLADIRCGRPGFGQLALPL